MYSPVSSQNNEILYTNSELTVSLNTLDSLNISFVASDSSQIISFDPWKLFTVDQSVSIADAYWTLNRAISTLISTRTSGTLFCWVRLALNTAALATMIFGVYATIRSRASKIHVSVLVVGFISHTAFAYMNVRHIEELKLEDPFFTFLIGPVMPIYQLFWQKSKAIEDIQYCAQQLKLTFQKNLDQHRQKLTNHNRRIEKLRNTIEEQRAFLDRISVMYSIFSGQYVNTAIHQNDNDRTFNMLMYAASHLGDLSTAQRQKLADDLNAFPSIKVQKKDNEHQLYNLQRISKFYASYLNASSTNPAASSSETHNSQYASDPDDFYSNASSLYSNTFSTNATTSSSKTHNSQYASDPDDLYSSAS